MGEAEFPHQQSRCRGKLPGWRSMSLVSLVIHPHCPSPSGVPSFACRSRSLSLWCSPWDGPQQWVPSLPPTPALYSHCCNQCFVNMDKAFRGEHWVWTASSWRWPKLTNTTIFSRRSTRRFVFVHLVYKQWQKKYEGSLVVVGDRDKCIGGSTCWVNVLGRKGIDLLFLC